MERFAAVAPPPSPAGKPLQAIPVLIHDVLQWPPRSLLSPIGPSAPVVQPNLPPVESPHHTALNLSPRGVLGILANLAQFAPSAHPRNQIQHRHPYRQS